MLPSSVAPANAHGRDIEVKREARPNAATMIIQTRGLGY